MDRSTAPEAAAGTAVFLVPGMTYCLLPHAWLQVTLMLPRLMEACFTSSSMLAQLFASVQSSALSAKFKAGSAA